MEKQRFNFKRFAIPQSGHLRERPGNINSPYYLPDMVFKAISTAKNTLCRRS